MAAIVWCIDFVVFCCDFELQGRFSQVLSVIYDGSTKGVQNLTFHYDVIKQRSLKRNERKKDKEKLENNEKLIQTLEEKTIC